MMENNIISETLQYLEKPPGFLKTYFEYIQLAQAGDVRAKQFVETIVSANPDMFSVIKELLKTAGEGDAYAKQIILDNLNAGSKS